MVELYHWFGWNTALFRAINSLDHGPVYDAMMLLISALGDHHLFPNYLIALTLFVMMRSAILWLGPGPAGLRGYLGFWAKIFLTLLLAFALDALIVHVMKEFFALPRPFIALDTVRMRILGELPPVEKYYQSFPSGHASFVTVMITGLWPALRRWAKPLALAFVLLVCWSRVALGMHFPADVVFGALLAFIITGAISRLVWRVAE